MNSKSELFTLVIDRLDKLNNIEVTAEMLKRYLDEEDYIEYYAFILHDCDVNDEGEVKTPHYHVVLKCNTRYAKDTVITDFAKSLKLNRVCVKCKAYHDIYGAVQYLIHQNDTDKYQYKQTDIISSSTAETVVYLIGQIEIDINKLIDICIGAKSLTEVYSTIGLKNSKLYHWIVKDIYSDIQTGVIN